MSWSPFVDIFAYCGSFSLGNGRESFSKVQPVDVLNIKFLPLEFVCEIGEVCMFLDSLIYVTKIVGRHDKVVYCDV